MIVFPTVVWVLNNATDLVARLPISNSPVVIAHPDGDVSGVKAFSALSSRQDVFPVDDGASTHFSVHVEPH